MLAFGAATLAYVVDPSLANDKVYLVVAMLAIFWGLTVANLFGTRWSARLNNPAVVLDTLLPAAVLIVLGVYWLSAGRHNQISFHAGATKVVALLVGLGTLALISTWLLDPAKGLYATERAGDLIPQLEYVNKSHAPVAVLVFQAALSSLLALLFLFLFLFVPSINTGHWMLTALTTQLVLMMYIQTRPEGNRHSCARLPHRGESWPRHRRAARPV